MLDLLSNDERNFAHHLRRLQSDREADGQSVAPGPTPLGNWLHYWNDADSVTGNLRKLDHWLQRARRDS